MDGVRAAKVGHTKSRNGCLTCRKRRVKCDEKRPNCGGCERLGLDCSFDAKQKPTLTKGTLKSLSRSLDSTKKTRTDDIGALEESAKRRMLELRLLHYWMSLKDDEPVPEYVARWRRLWYIEMPSLALSHKNLLYALMAVSATRLLWSMHNEDEELVIARDSYWSLALQEQQKAIEASHSSDALVFAAMLISINQLAETIGNNDQPYSPPLTWLQTARGTWTLQGELQNVESGTGIANLLELTAPVWRDCEQTSLDELGQSLLPDWLSISLLPDQDMRQAFMKVARYITLFKQAAEANEPKGVLSRRVFMFPGAMSDEFINCVRDHDVRALLLIGQFFTIVENTGILRYYYKSEDISLRKDIEGIRTLVPPEAAEILHSPGARSDASPVARSASQLVAGLPTATFAD
ncbi:hypothetical protein K461DRAFT_229204 [Myriangium duriaei CBS 260.36]|uniref:Zn(2)-C6 fungal-type domain-containing protein n=1 Tax=Myriangium duriaei CBS 260.36 TaxID=1168546 RepID=A0A9P4IYL6_9PEZI|nr:hypothetical protein K461DRAFT_229204 [Myriangium duriaei CBS 260.36]